MALTEGWKRRLEGWQKAITDSIYFQLGLIEISGFITKEQLTPEQALSNEFIPIPPELPGAPNGNTAGLKAQLYYQKQRQAGE